MPRILALWLPVALVVIGCAVALAAWWRRRGAATLTPPRMAPSGIGGLGIGGPEAADRHIDAVPATGAAGGSASAEAAAVQARVRLQLYHLAFGTRTAVAAVALGHEVVAATVRKVLVDIAAQPNFAPRRPLLLPRLVRAVNDSDVSRRELAGIIASDPALAGNLLRLANSSFYRIDNQPVESIDRAVAMLGTEGIRSLIAAALMQPVFRIGAGEFAQFPEITWEHTCRCASAAEAHAAIVENSDPFAGQLLGLLLGLAGIVIFRVALDQYAVHKLRADAGTLMALIDAHAAPVASQIAASWELSGRIGRALADQNAHRNTDALSPLGRALEFGTLIGALAVLRLHGLLTEDEVHASIAAAGYDGATATRIWARMAAPQD